MRVGVVVLVCACRSSEVTPDRAPLAEPSSELPAWFGTPGSRQITGTLVDAENQPIVGRMHLGIDVPDTTIWSGIDQTTDADGHFAFAVPRAGAYTLFATAPGVTSRVVEVDARKANVEVTVFAFACTPQPIVVQTSSGASIANARLDIGGTTTHADERGRLVICGSGQPLEAVVRASGFASYKTTIADREDNRPRDIELHRAIVIRGQIFDESGRPAANVGVQPMLVDQVQRSHSYPDLALPFIAASDADGRFVFRGLGEFDSRANTVAAYSARSIRGDDLFDHRDASIGAHASGELVLRRDRRDVQVRDEILARLDLVPVTWMLRGRIVRQGRPIPDAKIERTEIQLPPRLLGYSRADGTFELDVHDWSTRKQTFATLRITDAFGNTSTFQHANGANALDAVDAVFELR
ncbi:MAG: carboxypeptidase-like regulatory domain-containing protein [Kofleriaceae bacterium]